MTAGQPSFRSPRDAIAAGHRHGPPALHAGPVPDGDREYPPRSDEPRFRLRLREAEAGWRHGGDLRAEVDPGAKIWQLSVGEQQRVEILKLLYRGARDPDHGRAHRRAGAPGDRGAVRDPALDGRRRALDRLHQPQARRGPRDRRPDHGHAQRAGHGGGPPPERAVTGRPGPADGRPVRARDPGQDGATPGDVVLESRRPRATTVA